MTTQESICNAFVETISSHFPQAFVKAAAIRWIGEPTITVQFAGSTVWAFNIIHNDDLHMKLLVQKEGNDWVIDGPLYPKRKLREIGAPFRKIRGKSEAEAMDKLTKWFLKNKDALLNAKQVAMVGDVY